ncbi:MAG TPA: PEP/pyruvate-binding domain-containing protein, partial [Thermoleophilaceae bacterium]
MRQLADLRAADEAEFGGKSANLGELMAAGLRVPDGFALAGAADDAEVAAAYAKVGGPVAVRSSAVGEDSADATFAGMQETFLNVQGAGAVVDAVRRCWASLFGARTIAYRATRGLPQAGMDIAVVVQRQIASTRSGVMFT